MEVGIHGYWGSYANIFELTRQLGIYPFTDWTPSNQYSPEGLEVVAPIFRVRAPLAANNRLISRDVLPLCQACLAWVETWLPPARSPPLSSLG